MEFSSRTYRELGISRISGRRKEDVEMYVRAKALAATLASPLTRKRDSQKSLSFILGRRGLAINGQIPRGKSEF
ncbi:hypothetical protein V1477_003296 [Vespula maculifrons]|uniref:Uncharacterized protein n=1 Tax=Vespula maculifrons TaxID=7453 RepID=A0ABD2CWV3_VESMC